MRSSSVTRYIGTTAPKASRTLSNRGLTPTSHHTHPNHGARGTQSRNSCDGGHLLGHAARHGRPPLLEVNTDRDAKQDSLNGEGRGQEQASADA